MALDQIEAELTGGVPHRTCAVCHYLSERDAEWGKRLRALLANRGVKFKDLARALRDDPDEPDIPEKALSRHAQEGCLARERLR
jgi:hypothetical protein